MTDDRLRAPTRPAEAASRGSGTGSPAAQDIPRLLTANALWGALCVVVASAGMVLAAGIIASAAGPSEWGRWALASSLFAMGVTVDMGMGRALARQISQDLEQDRSSIPGHATSGMLVALVAALVMVAIGYLLRDAFLGSTADSRTRLLFHFAAMACVLKLARSGLQGILAGFLRIDVGSKIQLISPATSVAGAAVGLLWSAGSVGYAAGLTAGLAVEVALAARAGRRVSGLRGLFGIRHVSLGRALALIRFGAVLQAGSVVGAGVDPVLKFLLNRWSGLGMVGGFDLGWKATSAAVALGAGALQSFLPLASAETGRPGGGLLGRVHHRAAMLFGPPLVSGATAVTAGAGLIACWNSDGMVRDMATFVPYFAAIAVLVVSATPALTALVGAGRADYQLLTGAVQLASTAAAAPALWAADLAAWPAAALLVGVVANFLLIDRAARRVVGLSAAAPLESVPRWHWAVHLATWGITGIAFLGVGPGGGPVGALAVSALVLGVVVEVVLTAISSVRAAVALAVRFRT